MFDNIVKFFKKFINQDKKDSKDTAKERLHLVLMQDRANVSADFMELMKQEIIEVIKKYIDVDENSIDVKLTNKVNSDGTTGAPILYANIPILNVKDDTKQIHIDRKLSKEQEKEDDKKAETVKEQNVEKEEQKVEEKEQNEENLNEQEQEEVSLETPVEVEEKEEVVEEKEKEKIKEEIEESKEDSESKNSD